MNLLFELLAAFSAGLFAGAATYISLVEHPARMQCGPALAVAEFVGSYPKATRLQAPLAALGLSSAVAAEVTGSGVWWLGGGVLLGAVIPFTLLFMVPTNKRLLDPALEKDPALALQLLSRWSVLHAVPSIASLASFLIFVSLLRR